MGDRMRGKTYVYFNGKTEYIGTGGEEQTAYPLGSLVFGTLDVDWEPYLEQARALRRAYTGVDFGETCTMPQRLSEPETCVYYQVAEFYHNMSLSVKTVSPAFFDLLEGYCLAVWRAYDQESEPYLEALASGVNDTGLSRSEVHQRLIHLGNQAITGNIMEGYCRSFPAYTEQMKYYIEWETEDRSLCETALLVLDYFINFLKKISAFQKDLGALIGVTLCGKDGRPISAPSARLLKLAENDGELYGRCSRMLDDVHIKLQQYMPEGIKKGGIAAATFYASDNLPALVFLEFQQMCALDLRAARCENCGRLFLPFSSRTKYCDRVCDEDTGASCKEVAAREKYAAQVKADRARQLYQQLRNKYQMRCARAQGNTKMREDYNKWRDTAQKAMVKYQVGEMSFEQFAECIQIP